jgi:CRP/FNR family transcriptional regulator, cyclic AMP receptor protein
MPTVETYQPGSKQHLFQRLRRLSWLSQNQVHDLAQASQLLEVKRGTAVYSRSEIANLVYVILSGMAVLTLGDNGERVLMAVVGPGDIVGISALLGTGSRPFRCEALSECKVAALNAATFRSLTFDNPATFDKAMQATFGRWEALLRRYAQFMTTSTRGRIAVMLLELAERFGVSNDRGLLLPFLLSHAMLGAMVGASRQHVTMQLMEFEREGAVTRESRRLVIVPEKMKLALQ